MNIHEYQAKALFAQYGIPVMEGYPAFNMDDVKSVLNEHFKDGNCAIKAQIHAGGRGKAGGVKLASSIDEALSIAEAMFGMTLITKQTGEQGKVVHKLYLEQRIPTGKEYYLSLVIDTNIGKCVFIGTPEGGISVEEVAANTPERIIKCVVEPSVGFDAEDGKAFAEKMGLDKEECCSIMAAMYKLFIERDCSLIEINPMAICANHLVALDAKVNFDDGALFRHPENAELRDITEENPLEAQAGEYGMSYVSLNGNIGCICNGAGLGMSSMDTINYFGGKPANFLDCGGSITVEKAYKAFELVANEKDVEGIVVNIFGGIARTNLIAQGVVDAINDLRYEKPVVARIEGNGEKEAQEILKTAPANVYIASSCSDACQKMIQLLEGK